VISRSGSDRAHADGRLVASSVSAAVEGGLAPLEEGAHRLGLIGGVETGGHIGTSALDTGLDAERAPGAKDRLLSTEYQWALGREPVGELVDRRLVLLSGDCSVD
jgi:hypothetical protein